MATQGEGSRGGKIIGHYKSGRARYAGGRTLQPQSTKPRLNPNFEDDDSCTKIENEERRKRGLPPLIDTPSRPTDKKWTIKIKGYDSNGKRLSPIKPAHEEQNKALRGDYLAGGAAFIVGSAAILSHQGGLGKFAQKSAHLMVSKPAHIGDAAVMAGFGGFVSGAGGMVASDVYAKFAHRKLAPKLDADFQRPVQVESKATIKGDARYKNIEVINTVGDLFKSQTLNYHEKWMLMSSTLSAERGSNAAAWKNSRTGLEYVIASKKVNRQVLGHELGHINDYRDGSLNPKDSRHGFFDLMLGKQVEIETRAWNKSPFKGPDDEPIRTDALKSYKIGRDSARIVGGSTVLGAGIGAALYITGMHHH